LGTRDAAFVYLFAKQGIPATQAMTLSLSFFLFNNLGFHLLKENPLGFFDMLALKLTVLGKLLIQPHYLIPLGLSLWSVFILSSGRRRGEYSAWQRMVFHLALIVAGILAVFYFLPHPTLVQYYNQSLIFLIIASLPALRRLYAKAAAWRTIIPALYLLFFLLYPGLYILNIGSRYRDYKIDHVRRVVAFIKSHTLPEDVVLAEWVGYNIFSQRRQIQSDDYSGFQYVFSTNLVPYGRYRILTDEKVSQILARGEPRLVVIDNYVIPGWKTELEKKYRLLVQLDNTFIYELDLSKQSG